MSENIPHSLGGFRGAFESEHGRKPTEQEIWNAAIRSWRDITRQKSDSAKELEEVIADLLMYAGDNGYGHIDYADTMRHAAALLSAPALPVPSDSDDLIKALADVRDLFPIPERGSKLEHAWMEAVAFPESVPAYVRACIAPAAMPVGEPLTMTQINDMMHKEPLLNYKFMLNGGQGPCCKEGVEVVRAVERAHGITKKGGES